MGLVDELQAEARQALATAAAKVAEGKAELRAAVVKAMDVKLSVTEIAQLGDISRNTVYYWTSGEQQ